MYLPVPAETKEFFKNIPIYSQKIQRKIFKQTFTRIDGAMQNKINNA